MHREVERPGPAVLPADCPLGGLVREGSSAVVCSGNAMSLFYTVAYQLGFTPWEQMVGLPVAEQVSALFAREESGRQAPYGQALDLGCGSGVWSVKHNAAAISAPMH